MRACASLCAPWGSHAYYSLAAVHPQRDHLSNYV